MAAQELLPSIPEVDLNFPPIPLAAEALSFVRKHCDDTIYNHAARCAYWALILQKRLPQFKSSPVDIDAVLAVSILHDMGLATSTPESLPGLTTDRRFEVDGANIARDFIRSADASSSSQPWDEARLERIWTAIALHTTPSIARFAAPEVALSQMSIEADFAGPYWSPAPEEAAPITTVEYRAVTKIFPRADLNRAGFKVTMCNLCHSKPGTTFDNFVGIFGRNFGYDGQGAGKEEYSRIWEENQLVGPLLQGLDALDKLDGLA